ncbi:MULTISPECIES: LytR/AlgR family response regulator transcription factor [Tenacibaculum]|uniref:LytR/AlgR family response regulator transcription factor n=1 Tax=Tenacibaculum TaxID=104267 RepID=UPI0014322867|nr:MULTISPECIES: LytTR family DNA-binding domain-containing protein [Tenacibaculum]KAF9659197.1 response regulator transcription factor [Tenacibaculum mesophilum]MCG7500813.1 LytTR family DNA-binding domain-containing protein [Tenacibaculum sp. Mcav3-52]BFF39444.1 LytTR family DNA-binding domain-containing protein [Tenacibaculum mesophilum]
MKCIIIEDELPAQAILKKYIGKIPDTEIVHAFQTAIQANEFLKNNTVDVIFLDINLPDISGLDFIKTVKNPPKIVITTAYPDYAVNSFELETIVDYLVKPFSFDRFLKAISKVESQLLKSKTSEKEATYLNIDKIIHKVYLADILYLESDRNYVHFITSSKKLTIIDSLKNWNETLNSNKFVQIHKSYIVNLEKIEKYTGTFLYIENIKIPIGRTYKNNLLTLLKIKNQ